MRPPASPLGSHPRPADRVLLGIDLAATLVFAVEGALAGAEARFDALGLMVLAFATALGGGIVRDVLLGATPPAAIRDARYPVVAFTGGAIVLVLAPYVRAIPSPVILGLDAVGLALFAVAGARKALTTGVPALVAVLMGAITGAGGGTIRDLFLGRVPNLLHTDVYATAALAGATVLVVCERAGMRPSRAAWLGGVACFALRAVAVSEGWTLPRAAE